MEIKENKQENTNNTETIEVISSITDNSVLLEMCSDVIIKRQKPNRLAEVFNICCDVIFATLKFCFVTKIKLPRLKIFFLQI